MIYTTIQEAIREISQLEKAAERTTDIDRIIDLYQYALSICDSQNFTHRAATIHCKRADIELRHGYRYLQEAIHDADDSIEKDPDYLMVCMNSSLTVSYWHALIIIIMDFIMLSSVL